jgi:hypothetical protein
MNRRWLLALLSSLTVASVCAAGIATNRFTIGVRDKGGRNEEFLAVRGGKLTLGSSTFGKISDNRDAPDRWYILGTRIKSSAGGGYLAYDPAGKDTRVFLVPRPGKGTQWTITLDKDAREGKRGVIRAGCGRLKGWFLSVEETREKQKDGTRVTVRRFVLAKAPARKLEAERIYEHK